MSTYNVLVMPLYVNISKLQWNEQQIYNWFTSSIPTRDVRNEPNWYMAETIRVTNEHWNECDTVFLSIAFLPKLLFTEVKQHEVNVSRKLRSEATILFHFCLSD